MKCNFTFKHYDEILKVALQNGYKFLLFGENDKKYKKIIYLRHDVDLSPNNVVRMAKIEQKYGVRSTYFYLLHDISYNILEREVFEGMKGALKLEHQIGLHFDGQFYRIHQDNFKNLEKVVLQDLSILRHILRKKIGVVSFHDPSTNGVFNRDFNNKEIINVYSDYYFKKIKYLSDSLQTWREDCLCKILTERRYNKMQILIHPCCWNHKNLTLRQCANHYIFERVGLLNKFLKKTKKVYLKSRFKK